MAADTSPKAPIAPESSSADTPSWREYKKLLENYYFLDKQKAGHISCRISVPPIQGMIDHLQQKNGNKVTIDSNLSDWSVTYDRTRGVSFNSPHIHIKASFPPDAKLADVEQFENWRKEAEKTLNKVVLSQEQGIADHLTDMNMISLTPKEKKNLSLTKNGDATVVSYGVDENDYIRSTYSDTTQQRTNSSPTFHMTSILDYQPLNGKLALVHKASKSTVGPTKVNRTISISYQDLGSAFFPAQILEDLIVSEGAQQSKPQHVEIDFKDCKTSDVSP